MSDLDAFVGRVRGLLISLSDVITAEQAAEVEHLIDHDESGEALRALAWIIVDNKLVVQPELVARLRELADGLVADEHMPPGFVGRGETDA